ncbi:hypothetical protein [Chryseobacterium sp. FH2]|uniref:hypothetical protein n=1 Tax=Chryseobacterium sp. FH2 TaxID=1674291 RepID=UPI00103C47F3|nr:hypothetical protein [Chryseobacterium sp. FH2]
MSTSSDPTSKEYNSKSVWKEDETYIKNVMKVYGENESEIKKGNGTPLWDYAMTMGRMDESFLIVPVANGKTIVSCIQVPRNDDEIKFVYDNDQEHIKFFQGYTTVEKRQPSKMEQLSSQTAKGIVQCAVSSVSMWYPNSETNPDAGGHWETQYITTCNEVGGGDGPSNPNPENPTYPYPGGGGGAGGTNIPPQPSQTPCEKTKGVLEKTQVQAKIKELKEQAPKGGEKGVKFKADGTPSETLNGGKHSVDLGDKTGYQGGYHNHTPSGIPMLSPPDIDQLLGFARAQPTALDNTNNAYLGMVAPNGMHYVMWFKGTYAQSLQTYSQDTLDKFVKKYREFDKNLTDWAKNGTKYVNSNGDLNNLGAETLFFETLKNMGLVNMVTLQRVESNNTIKSISLNSNNEPIPTNCP